MCETINASMTIRKFSQVPDKLQSERITVTNLRKTGYY